MSDYCITNISTIVFFLNYSAADRHVSSTEFNYFSKTAKTLYFGAMALFFVLRDTGADCCKNLSSFS